MGAVNPIESLNGARARTLDTNTFGRGRNILC